MSQYSVTLATNRAGLLEKIFKSIQSATFIRRCRQSLNISRFAMPSTLSDEFVSNAVIRFEGSTKNK